MKDILFKKLREKRLNAFEVFKDPDYSGVFDFIKDLYKKKAHFIYELLQNADDAKAKVVKFILRNDRLVFIHNGTEKFSISDDASHSNKKGHINSITSIGASTKSGSISDDDLKIGKFGIGFKSVFSFTNTPEIYDDEFRFRIENYIVPELLQPDYDDRKPGETVFVFPFNNDNKPGEVAYEEIKGELLSLKHPMLFLNSINSIEWQYPGKSGSYSIKYDPDSTEQRDETEYSFFTETRIANDQISKQGIKISRYISDDNNRYKYSLVFFLKDNAIEYRDNFNAYCYFRTEVNPHLKFIIHAPFLITYNRETIKDDKWNVLLLSKLAELMADSLEFFKDKELINESLFKALPIYHTEYLEARNNQGSSLLDLGVFQRKLIDVLSNRAKAYFPSHSGRYLTLNQACLARGEKLLELLSPEDLQATLSIPGVDWVFGSLYESDDLFKFMQNDLKVRVFASKEIHNLLSDDLLRKQPVEWLHKLYDYINDASSIARHFKEKPTLRIEGGTSNIALIQDNRTRAYLPYEDDEIANDILRSMGVAFVSGELLDNEVTKLVLKQFFGMDTPDKDLHNIINEIKDDFWEDRSIDWLISFYGFMMKKPSTLVDIVKYKPIVRVKGKNKNSPPINSDDNPLVYFPGDNSPSQSFYEEVGFSYLEPSLYKDETANKFLHQFLQIPTAEDHEVFRNILTQLFTQAGTESYREMVRDSSEAKREYCEFIDALAKFVGRYNKPEMQPLFELLSRCPFLVCTSSQGKAFEKGDDIFYPTEDLQDFFEGTEILWLDKEFYDGFITDHDSFQLLLTDYAKIHFSPIYDMQRRTIRGLPEYLYRISNIEQSVRASKILIELLEKSVVKSLHETQLPDLLNNAQWLFDNHGNQVKAIEISEADLHSVYDQFKSKDFDHILAVLMFKEHVIDVQAEQLYQTLAQKASKSEYITSILEAMINYSEDDYIRLKGSMSLIQRGASTENRKIPEYVDVELFDQYAASDAMEGFNFGSSYEALRESALKHANYSYQWFIDLIKLEIISSKENTRRKDITLYFDNIEPYARSNKMAVITNDSNYIPSVVENLADFKLSLTMKDNTKRELDVEAVSKRIENKGSYPIHKLLVKFKPDDIENYHNTNLDEVSSISLNIKDPVFLLQELLNNFLQLPEMSGYEINNEFNFQKGIGKIIKNMSFIYGPPGTGKTTYIADKLICDLLDKTYKHHYEVSGIDGFLTKEAYTEYIKRDGKLNILVLAPTNKAADVVTQKVMQICEQNGNTNYRDYLVRFETTDSEDIEREASHIILERNDNKKFSQKKGVVVITTIHRFPYDGFKSVDHGNMFKNKMWDIVIFDEASMIPIASIVNALFQIRYANPKCQLIITGDPHQIPPVQLVDLWSNENIYSMFGLQSFDPDEQEKEMYDTIKMVYPVKNLKIQYRSTPSIGELFSQFSYDAQLTHYRQNDRLSIPELGFKIDDFTIIRFPVNSNNLLFKASRLKKSPYHPYSVLFTVMLIEHFLKKLGDLEQEVSIGIVCPYRVQADLVGKILANKFPLNEKVKVTTATVHGFQGDECDIVICLLNAPAGLYQTTSHKLYVNNQNLLNVAISRARDYLILLIPDEDTRGIHNLTNVNKILELIGGIKKPKVYSSKDIEMHLMKDTDHIAKRTFTTSHQLVNVYSINFDSEYEFRISDDAVDVQINELYD